jgi:hypothetical protein
MITQEKVLELFDYKDGKLYWKTSKSNCIKKGERAGCLSTNGYWRICIDRKSYREHKIIFLFHNGYMPKWIDHIDGNKLNNRIENLRSCTRAENSWNMKKFSNNTSGIKGVCWSKEKEKYIARITQNKQVKFIGYFDTLKDASEAIFNARNNFHGNFARHE